MQKTSGRRSESGDDSHIFSFLLLKGQSFIKLQQLLYKLGVSRRFIMSEPTKIALKEAKRVIAGAVDGQRQVPEAY
jgi:hypothetical protein